MMTSCVRSSRQCFLCWSRAR